MDFFTDFLIELTHPGNLSNEGRLSSAKTPRAALLPLK
jgi:hypothetical protein